MGQDNKTDSRFSGAVLSISSLEADIAYFDARLALLEKEPESCYQEAQIRAYKEMVIILGEHLKRLQKMRSKGQSKKRVKESKGKKLA